MLFRISPHLSKNFFSKNLSQRDLSNMYKESVIQVFWALLPTKVKVRPPATGSKVPPKILC
jgi:hypothetical protein